MQELLSPEQAGEKIGVCAETIRRYCRSGLLPAFRIGRALIRIEPTDLNKMVAAGRIKSSKGSD